MRLLNGEVVRFQPDASACLEQRGRDGPCSMMFCPIVHICVIQEGARGVVWLRGLAEDDFAELGRQEEEGRLVLWMTSCSGERIEIGLD